MNKITAMLFISISLLYGCGGSDKKSTPDSVVIVTPDPVQGLSVPDNVSVVTAKTGAAPVASAVSKPHTGSMKRSTAMTTDYINDAAKTYVYDSSMQALDSVNMILCLIAQTGAQAMVNKGSYIALVNEDKCENGQGGSSGSTGESSGGNVATYNPWTITSTRATNSDPQHVQIWIPNKNSDGNEGPENSQSILVELNVNEGPSNTKPFGNFTLNFKGVIDAGLIGGQAGVEKETMRGTLQTVNNNSLPQFKFINVGGNRLPNNNQPHGYEEAANVLMNDAAGNSGQAITHMSENFDNGTTTESSSETFAVSFNTTHVSKGKDNDNNNTLDEQQCLSRESFDTHVWRYNLYHQAAGTFNGRSVTAGQRVELNSGFPFRYDSDNNGSDDAHGWVGYHGVWANGSAIADGATIRKQDYQNNTTTNLTVRIAPGKLIRRTAAQELLNTFNGDDFQFWGRHPTLEIFREWQVTVNSDNTFNITAVINRSGNSPVTSETIDHDDNPNTAEQPVLAVVPLSNGFSLWLWSHALGGSVVYVHSDSIAQNDRLVTFYNQEFVAPADPLFSNSAVTLYCYERCLKGGLTQSNVDAASSQNDLYYNYSGTPFTYSLSSSNGKVILTDNSNNAVVSAASLNMTAIGNSWGINTGEMLTSPLSNPLEPWQSNLQPVTYRWETGSNDWNRQVTVVDNTNQALSFDRPINFNYTHHTANDANDNNTYDGKKFVLGYGGLGQLWGFPHLESSEHQRWYSVIALKDGVELNDGTRTYLVKALQQEQSMRTVDVSQCASLNVDAVLANSNLALPVLGDIGAINFTLAGKPNVTAAPAVIEGVVQQATP